MDMRNLIKLLKSGECCSTTMLAEKMGTTVSDVERTLEYLERIGVLRRTKLGKIECADCGSCTSGKGGGQCKGCMPKGGFDNMGTIWEVADN